MHSYRQLLLPVISACAAMYSPLADAQQFAAVVSPPRVEIEASPGERVRQVVEITNAGPQPATYHLRTADWTLAPDASVSFSDELAKDSCRPWVAIERNEISVPGGGRFRYRFEVEPPADAQAGECRFALMIEGDPQEVRTASGLNVPVSGRIGVIVYVNVGDAAPDLQIVGSGVAEIDGRLVPVLRVHNSGNAHGRLEGFLSGTDSGTDGKGRRLDFAPSTLPILPGETRTISLSVSEGDKEVTDLVYPVKVKGELEWGDGKHIELDQLFTR
jgi:hypothetical protein